MSAQKFIANLRILSGFTGTALTAITNAAQCLVSDISDFIREEIFYYCKEQDISIESSNTQALLNKLNFDNLFDLITISRLLNAVEILSSSSRSRSLPPKIREVRLVDLPTRKEVNYQLRYF